jgi:hypothetical protein
MFRGLLTIVLLFVFASKLLAAKGGGQTFVLNSMGSHLRGSGSRGSGSELTIRIGRMDVWEWRGRWGQRPKRLVSRHGTGKPQSRFFLNDEDRRRFMGLVSESPERFHRVVRTLGANLSHAIRWLNVTYSVRFNWAHRQVGHANVIDSNLDKCQTTLLNYGGGWLWRPKRSGTKARCRNAPRIRSRRIRFEGHRNLLEKSI